MPLRSLVLALVVLSLMDCKSKPTDDKPGDLITRDDIVKEQKRVDNGETVGQALQSPKVIVDATHVSINGSQVAPRSDVDSGGKVKRVEAVFDWVKGLREHWKEIHPGQEFVSGAEVSLPDDVAFADAVSLIMTLASAGYPNAMKIQSGDASAVINLPIRRLPEPDNAPKDTRPALVVELWNSSGAWGERLTNSNSASADAQREAREFGLLGLSADPNAPTAAWGRESPPSASVAPLAAGCPASRAVTLPTVTDALRAECGGACGGFVIGGTPKFHDALAMAAAALHPIGGIIPPHQTVAFQVDPACSATTAPSQQAVDAYAPRAKLSVGESTVVGDLPPEVVQRIVRQNFGQFRICYESGLRTNPKLAGKVSVKFVIDHAGMVSSAADGGSDLPDQAVVQCVVKAFNAFSFPQPENGIVTAVYTVKLSPP